MGRRRPDGALEGDILAVLWHSDEALMPGEVNALLGDKLAYTTVMTVLTRLWKKGLVKREAQGRGFAYRAALSENDLATRKMTEILEMAGNRSSLLASFVESLSARDVRRLRRLLGDLDEKRS